MGQAEADAGRVNRSRVSAWQQLFCSSGERNFDSPLRSPMQVSITGADGVISKDRNFEPGRPPDIAGGLFSFPS